MNLFQLGNFTLASGKPSDWKIDCDALTLDDLETLAMLLAKKLPVFGRVEGVPTGGLRLAQAMQKYALNNDEFPLLIVDDVLTTGRSIERHRAGREAIGAVLFARQECPAWITPLFQMGKPTKSDELLEQIREGLENCEDAGGFCLWLGELLGVDLEA